MKKVLISSTTDLVTDQRVLRIAHTFQSRGWNVFLIGRRLPDSFSLTGISCPATRFRMIFNRGPLFYACFNVRLFFHLLFSATDLLWSNDLDTLPSNFLASRLKNIPLIYDSHEYFTEVPELTGRPFIRMIWRKIEGCILPGLKYVVTVSNPIAEAYASEYGIEVTVLRNVPLCGTGPVREPETFIDGNKKVILYQGTLNKHRGIDLMIRAMSFIRDAVFVIAGSGPEGSCLKAQIKEMNLEARVKMVPRLLPSELRKKTPSASLGISLEEPQGLNYVHALPNKIFDYIYARVPVLVSPLPEMSRLVKEYKVGAVLDSYDPEAIAKQVNKLLNMKESEQIQNRLEKAAQIFCWEKEETILLELLNRIQI